MSCCFVPASHPTQQSFVRIVNVGDEDHTVTVTAIDDSGESLGTVPLEVPANGATHFNSPAHRAVACDRRQRQRPATRHRQGRTLPRNRTLRLHPHQRRLPDHHARRRQAFRVVGGGPRLRRQELLLRAVLQSRQQHRPAQPATNAQLGIPALQPSTSSRWTTPPPRADTA